jgi:hypothetical protein
MVWTVLKGAVAEKVEEATVGEDDEDDHLPEGNK